MISGFPVQTTSETTGQTVWCNCITPYLAPRPIQENGYRWTARDCSDSVGSQLQTTSWKSFHPGFKDKGPPWKWMRPKFWGGHPHIIRNFMWLGSIRCVNSMNDTYSFTIHMRFIVLLCRNLGIFLTSSLQRCLASTAKTRIFRARK